MRKKPDRYVYPAIFSYDSDGVAVSFPDLPGCVTCGETMERVAANAEDAKRAWLEAAIQEGMEIAEPSDTRERRIKFPAQENRRYVNHQVQA